MWWVCVNLLYKTHQCTCSTKKILFFFTVFASWFFILLFPFSVAFSVFRQMYLFSVIFDSYTLTYKRKTEKKNLIYKKKVNWLFRQYNHKCKWRDLRNDKHFMCTAHSMGCCCCCRICMRMSMNMYCCLTMLSFLMLCFLFIFTVSHFLSFSSRFCLCFSFASS